MVNFKFRRNKIHTSSFLITSGVRGNECTVICIEKILILKVTARALFSYFHNIRDLSEIDMDISTIFS